MTEQEIAQEAANKIVDAIAMVIALTDPGAPLHLDSRGIASIVLEAIEKAKECDTAIVIDEAGNASRVFKARERE